MKIPSVRHKVSHPAQTQYTLHIHKHGVYDNTLKKKTMQTIFIVFSLSEAICIFIFIVLFVCLDLIMNIPSLRHIFLHPT